LLGGDQPTAPAWDKILAQVEDRGDEIAAGLLARRK